MLLELWLSMVWPTFCLPKYHYFILNKLHYSDSSWKFCQPHVVLNKMILWRTLVTKQHWSSLTSIAWTKKKKHILKYLNLILKESYADFERHEGKCKNLPHLVNFNLYISNKCNSNILQIYGCICLTF